MNWEPCRCCGEQTSVHRDTKLVICEECRPAYEAERHHRLIQELLASPLDIDRWADEAENGELDIERMLGMKVRKPPVFVQGDPEWFLSGGLPSLGKGYS